MNDITKNYTGADATGEILVMLAIAFILGYLLRWAWEKFMYDDVYDMEDIDMVAPAAVAPVARAVAEPASQPQPVVMPYKQDDLKIVEGIGPKIESLLHDGGIKTWRALADAPVGKLKGILNNAGERYRIHDPSTWPEQARLADEHKWDELEEYQDFLSGGKMIG